LKNLRIYGNSPYNIALIHGGPGAPGEMAPVARVLAVARGVLEPLQTADSVDGQVDELSSILRQHADLPVALIGYSWGAWLSYILAARFPELVRKLILVSSGPFEEKYATDINRVRLGRLNVAERAEVNDIMRAMEGPDPDDKDKLLARFGRLISMADTYDMLPHEDELLECSYDINVRVWEQAAELRSSGELIRCAEKIKCPVVAIHGNYDPHPAAGVGGPLSKMLKDFRFILLDKCGHTPWLERQAAARFYDILQKETV
jgi:pimeloyl-ACP methyl ester carboxylesterase